MNLLLETHSSCSTFFIVREHVGKCEKDRCVVTDVQNHIRRRILVKILAVTQFSNPKF